MKKEKQNNLTAGLSGVSGEYFVAAELSRRGYIASITLRNTKGVDILCSNADATKSVGIQVKTNKGTRRIWVLNEKAEKFYAVNLFYVFVNLNNNIKAPDYFIVPSKTVAKFTKKNDKEWRESLRRDGKPHKANTMRKFIDSKEGFLNRWNLLGL